MQGMFVASGEYGRVSPHVNFGYTFSSGETSELAASDDTPLTHSNNGAPIPNVTLNKPDLSVPDEVNYTFGVDVAATPQVTLGFDLRGRTIREFRGSTVVDYDIPQPWSRGAAATGLHGSGRVRAWSRPQATTTRCWAWSEASSTLGARFF